MSKTEWVYLGQIAALFGVALNSLKNCRSYLDGFPKARQEGKSKVYRLREVMEWAEGKDIHALVAAACLERNKKYKKYTGANSPARVFNQDARAFISGVYLPAAQKQQIEYKKLVARTTQPKTKTVHLVFDWMIENGRIAGYRSKPCNH